MMGYPLETVVDVFRLALQLSSLNVDGAFPTSFSAAWSPPSSPVSLLPQPQFLFRHLCPGLLPSRTPTRIASPLPRRWPRWPDLLRGRMYVEATIPAAMVNELPVLASPSPDPMELLPLSGSPMDLMEVLLAADHSPAEDPDTLSPDRPASTSPEDC